MIMSFMGIDFGDSESKEGEWKELESVFKGGAVGDLWEERVLLAGFCVCLGFKSSKGTFYCETVRIFEYLDPERFLPLNISLRCPFKIHVRGFRSWLFRNFATARASGFGGPGVMGCGAPCCGCPWGWGWPPC
jgi:hypothetical protein